MGTALGVIGGITAVAALVAWIWWPELSEPFKQHRADHKIKKLTATAIRDMNKHIPSEWRL